MVQGRNRDESKLSKDPRTVRARIRRRHARVNEDIDYLLKIQGYKPVAEWDLDELSRGKPRNPDTGRWSTGQPAWITPRVQEEVKRRFREETLHGLTKYTSLALKVLGKLLVSDETDHLGKPIVSARDRIDIAKFIIEHTVGKPPTKIEIGDAQARWRGVLADSVALPSGEDYHPTIEGDWEEGADDDEPE